MLLQNIPKFEALQKFSEQYPELDPAAVVASLTLWCAGSQLATAFEAHFAQFSLSPGRFGVLINLLRSGEAGLSPADIAERTGVTRATITGLLDGLEAAGLVSREAHPTDRRSLQVVLTEQGRQQLDRMLPDHYRRIAALMSNLTTAEQLLLTELLQKVVAQLPALQSP